jgi:hypothetical protein
MGLFDRFKKASKSSAVDRVLSPSQIQEVLASDYGSGPDAVIFVCAPSAEPITPVDMMLVPFIQADFTSDPKLGMVYGTGSGCALVRKAAIEKVQALARTGSKNIVSCQAFIDALRQLGYSVRQDPKLSLDLLP